MFYFAPKIYAKYTRERDREREKKTTTTYLRQSISTENELINKWIMWWVANASRWIFHFGKWVADDWGESECYMVVTWFAPSKCMILMHKTLLSVCVADRDFVTQEKKYCMDE